MMYAAIDQSWRAYLKTAIARRRRRDGDRVFEQPQLGAKYDWSDIGALLPVVGFDAALDAALQSELAADAAAARPSRRARRHLLAAWTAFAAGDDGHALAASTAAIEAGASFTNDVDLDGDYRAHFLRGVIKLGRPEMPEPTLIDAAGAHRDFAEASRRAAAALDAAAPGSAAETAIRRLAFCEFATAWAAFCAGAPQGAFRRADRAAALAPEFGPARYLGAKAAAALEASHDAEECLLAAARLDAAFLDLAVTDRDFLDVAEARGAVVERLRSAARRAHGALEAARAEIVTSVAGLGFEAAGDPVPEEMREPTPFPPEGAPIAAEVATMRLVRQAMIAAIADVEDALATERPAAELRRRALREEDMRRGSSSGGLAAAAGLFGAFAGATVSLVGIAVFGAPTGAERAVLMAAGGASVLSALLCWLGARAVVRTPRRSQAVHEAAEARADALAHAARVTEALRSSLEALPERADLAILWSAEAAVQRLDLGRADLAPATAETAPPTRLVERPTLFGPDRPIDAAIDVDAEPASPAPPASNPAVQAA